LGLLLLPRSGFWPWVSYLRLSASTLDFWRSIITLTGPPPDDFGKSRPSHRMVAYEGDQLLNMSVVSSHSNAKRQLFPHENKSCTSVKTGDDNEQDKLPT
jgi:hypothetical protein